MNHDSPDIFSRIYFDAEYARVFSSIEYWPDSDVIGIRRDMLVYTFRKYFRIVTHEEYGMPTPIPMPRDPRRN